MLNTLVGIVFPNLCVGCNAALVGGEIYLCTSCIVHLPETNFHTLPQNPLEKTFWGRVNLQQAFAFLRFKKQGIVQELLHKLKYGNHPDLGVYIGTLYGAKLKQAGKQIDAVVAVPLHHKKLLQRGYNQSDCFAQGISQALGCPHFTNALKRKKATATQTKKKRFERWINVDEVFEVSQPDLLQNKHILLVDDVITTGATIEACVIPLLEITPQVSVAAIACVVHQ